MFWFKIKCIQKIYLEEILTCFYKKKKGIEKSSGIIGWN